MRSLLAILATVLLAGCVHVEQLIQATKAQVTLVDGLRKFDAGDHEGSAKVLAAALKMGGLGQKD